MRNEVSRQRNRDRETGFDRGGFAGRRTTERLTRSGAVTHYKHEALMELADQQVRFAPPPRRLEQLQRAERLLSELDPDKEYPYQFICYRVTDYRPDAYADLLLGGQALVHDLGMLIAE